MQQNSNSWLGRDENATVTHMISECNKLVQKVYKSRHDWVGKVNHWELCKRLKVDHTKKWHMYKPEFVLENEMHQILWDFQNGSPNPD